MSVDQMCETKAADVRTEAVDARTICGTHTYGLTTLQHAHKSVRDNSRTTAACRSVE